jgi:tetratricopeptide (TPR) repeat protein
MRRFSVVRFVLLIGTIALLFSACHRDPNVRKQKYFKSGQQYFEQGKYREAAIEFQNAARIDPHYAAAHYSLAQSYLRLQQWTAAFNELSRTIDIEPANYAAHLDIANMLIAAKQLKRAHEHVDLLLEQQPNDFKVHNVAATLLGAEGNLQGGIQEAQKAISLAPKEYGPYLTLALLQLRTGQTSTAGQNLKAAANLAPTSPQAQLALAGFYQSQGQFGDAEQQLKQAISTSPKNPELRAALVKLYAGQGKKAEAEQVSQQAKQDLAGVSAGYRMLGDYYYATGDIDRAESEYASLYRDHPQDLQVKKNYIQLLILKNQLDDAEKLTDEILKINASDPEGLVYRGQILLRQEKPNEAVNVLQTAIKNDPTNGIAHYHLGIAYGQQGNLLQAENEWREAVRLRPDMIEAQRALAESSLRRGDMAALEESANQIISLRSASPEGYLFRAAAYINRRQYAKAEKDIRQAMTVAPQNPAPIVQMGNLNLIQKNFAEAAKWYQMGLDRDSHSVESLSGLMNTYLAQKQTDKAIAVANQQIEKVPDSSAFYDLLGTALFNNKKDPAAAETVFRKALDLDPNNTDALVKLGQVLVSKGSADEAMAHYQQAVKQNPKQSGFYILMGQLYEAKGDSSNAKQMYQKALEVRPNSALAANNLAYLMVQTGDNLDTALSLAQIARRGMSDSPNTADTLGWVYYQKGIYRSAIDLFEESLRLAQKSGQADNPTVHYHLGLAYNKTGEFDLAKQHLQKVLKINPHYRDADEIKKLLAQIG